MNASPLIKPSVREELYAVAHNKSPVNIPKRIVPTTTEINDPRIRADDQAGLNPYQARTYRS